MHSKTSHRLLVCTTFGSTWVNGQRQGKSRGETLWDHLQTQLDCLDPAIQIHPVECMSACSHACVIALAAPQKTTYVFGDLSLEDDESIFATAALYASKTDGILPWADRPHSKRGLLPASRPWVKSLDTQSWIPRNDAADPGLTVFRVRDPVFTAGRGLHLPPAQPEMTKPETVSPPLGRTGG
ncbi:DUF1636 domain-containing protein [Synechococcus sp. Nb3U1]|uniref:DUF1636 family protein n=1 Tax=Synechococcus sp. Nb3U1 TaxID=1914529 RepID=UPI001F48306F|nr:DUF1636 domain-containing protein [Synechococcus sp. Nb3U1]MCF2972564.1 DUF1636 domain-containing protein [Synechococcus sp. Nb3U1]